MKLVLGSTSPFRKTLLERLHIDFVCDSPDIDETPLENEPVEEMVVRLAIAKAQAISQRHPDSLIIGSDQSAVLNGEKLSKPGNFENAFKQLTRASGQKTTKQILRIGSRSFPAVDLEGPVHVDRYVHLP